MSSEALRHRLVGILGCLAPCFARDFAALRRGSVPGGLGVGGSRCCHVAAGGGGLGRPASRYLPKRARFSAFRTLCSAWVKSRRFQCDVVGLRFGCGNAEGDSAERYLFCLLAADAARRYLGLGAASVAHGGLGTLLVEMGFEGRRGLRSALYVHAALVAFNRLRHGAGGDAVLSYAGRLKECGRLSSTVADILPSALRAAPLVACWVSVALSACPGADRTSAGIVRRLRALGGRSVAQRVAGAQLVCLLGPCLTSVHMHRHMCVHVYVYLYDCNRLG